MDGIEILAVGFTLGLAGSLHCAGMCGPIAIALPHGSKSRSTHIAHRFLYQAGRVITYSILGIITGIGASIFRVAGLSRSLSITAGVSMLLVAGSRLFFQRRSVSGTGKEYLRKVTGLIQKKLRMLLSKHGAWAHVGIGLANGLLPCGLVTAALLTSLSTPSLLKSGLFMASFGLGTVPVMSGVAIFGLAIPCSWRSRFQIASPVFTVILAILIIFRGLGLGIPFVSPSVQAQQLTCCPH